MMRRVEGTAISVSGLSKTYPNGNVGVKNLTVDVPRGQIVGLLGPNGSGKTTTINLLTASFPPSSGDGQVLGFDIRRQAHLIRRRTSLVPQYESIDWSLTVYQNLRVFASLLHVSDPEGRISGLLHALELEDHRHSPVEELSGGQIRRVQLARAMLFSSDLVFVDEPTAGLDPLGSHEVLSYLREQARSGRTVLLASNIMTEMEQICDRILFLNKGVLVYDGSPTDIIGRCRLKERITVDLEHEPSESLIDTLNDLGLEVHARKPLVVSGTEATRLVVATLSSLTDQNGSFRGFTVHKPGLSDAFVSIVRDGGLDG